MIYLIKTITILVVSFIVTVLSGLIIIPILRKLKASQELSKYLADRHKTKVGTPTMGGILFISTPIILTIILYLSNKIEISFNFLIIIITYFLYGLIGFIDDYLIIKKHNNKGLTSSQKFIFQLVIATIFFYLFMIGNNEPLLWIHALNIRLNIGWLYGIFILFVLVASSNAVNLTDGLDGLAGGLSFIAVLVYAVITYSTDWLYGYEEISLFLFSVCGSILGFLIYNTNPAKVFMGDTGSLALGALLGSVAIITRHELLLVVIGIVFVIETISCIIQILYYKKTKKRFFPMTPIHHTFEKIGWQERDIVKLFWIIGVLGGTAGFIYGVLL